MYCSCMYFDANVVIHGLPCLPYSINKHLWRTIQIPLSQVGGVSWVTIATSVSQRFQILTRSSVALVRNANTLWLEGKGDVGGESWYQLREGRELQTCH